MFNDTIEVDTEQVGLAAANMTTLNQKIKDHFQGLNSTFKELSGSWEGQAAGYALQTYYLAGETLSNVRYGRINNFVAFLRKDVGLGYEETEETNRTLADMFDGD